MAFDDSILAGSTSKIIDVVVYDSTGAGKTGITHTLLNTGGGGFVREGATRQSITFASGTAGDAYSSGKWCEVDSTNMPGVYQFHIPNTALAAGVAGVRLFFKAAGMLDKSIRIKLVAHNVQDPTRLGLAALPNANAGASGGLPTGDASGRVDLGRIMGQTVTFTGNVLTVPFGVRITPTATGTTGLDIRGAAAGTGVYIQGGQWDGVPDSTGRGLVITVGSDGGIAADAVQIIKSTTSTNAITVTGQVDADITGDLTGNVTGNVGSISGVTFPANFATLGINASGHITRVVLTDTATTLTNLPTIPANWLTAAGIASGALNGKGDWLLSSGYTAPDNAGISAIAGNVTTLLNRIGAWTGTGVNTILGAFKALLSKDASTPSDIGGTFAASTDSTEAIRDRGDAAWTGGGGTADWTADERTAIRSILGIPGSGTTPVTPTTGMLDTINDNIAALSAGSGSGAFVVTITVTDGTNPIQNAIVRLTEGANTFRATTNASGVATFSLNAATYTRSITRDGYTFTPNTLAVAGTTSSTSVMTATTIPPPADPDGCTVNIRARTQQLVPQAGVTIGFRYLTIPAGSGMALPVNPLLITTDSNGDARAELLQAATVKYWRGREPAFASTANSFVVPAAASYSLPDLLGEDQE